MRALRRLRACLRGQRLEPGLRDELEWHRAEIQQALERHGMAAADALPESRRRMGNMTLAAEDARDIWIWRWLDEVRQDTHYTVRTLRRQMPFTIVALLTLALGIGATTAIFSVVYAIALKPLPYGHSSGLVQVGSGLEGTSPLTLDQYNAVARDTRELRDVAAARLETSAVQTRSGTQRIRNYACTLNVFDVLDVRPQIGRTFAPSDANQRVVVLAHEWWMQEFGGDARILGRLVAIDDTPYEVIGVMPADFQFPYRRAGYAWMPADQAARAHTDRMGVWTTIGRLRPGAARVRARAELAVVSDRLAEADAAYEHRPLRMTPLLEAVIGAAVQSRLFLLLTAVGLVLLIACVNVASLLLTRLRARSREMAVRAAIGAGRGRLVRQIFVETLLMGAVGGGAGLLLAHWMLTATVGLIPSGIPRADSIGIDGTVLGVTLLLSLFSGATAGLVPAWLVSRRELHDELRDGVAAPAGTGRAGALFLFTETSFAVVLVIAAAVVLHGFEILTHVDPGFDFRHLTSISVNNHLPPAEIRELTGRLRGMPGVRDVTGADLVPFGLWTIASDLRVQGRPANPFDDTSTINTERVLPAYFRTLHIPVLRGREITDRDLDGAPLVALLNQAAVRQFFPSEDPLGVRIYGGDGWYEVVGVVDDTRWKSLADDAPPAAYFPLLQGSSWRLRTTTFLVRMDTPPSHSSTNLQTAVKGAMGPGVTIQAVQSMDAMVARSIQQWTFQAVVLGMFGGLALLLAVVGIFGVTSYAVVQRTHEIGVRIALGAQRSDLLRLIVGSTARPVIAGLCIGIAGAALTGRLLSAFVFRIAPTDGPTYAVTAILFLAAAIGAAAIPGYRATRVDPIGALRQ